MNEKYGSAPIVFLDEEKRKEWEGLDPAIKKNVLSILIHVRTKWK